MVAKVPRHTVEKAASLLTTTVVPRVTAFQEPGRAPEVVLHSDRAEAAARELLERLEHEGLIFIKR